MLTLKVAQEITARAKAEADTVMMSKCVEALQSVVDIKSGPKEKSQERPKTQEKCTFVDKPGGYSKGSRCKFVHPEKEANKAGSGEDCSYWMEGHCKYSNSHCRKEHIPEKKGSKTKETKKSEQEVFVQSLAKAFAQVNAEAQTSAAAPGLENQKNMVGVLQGLVGTLQPPSITPTFVAGNTTPPFPADGYMEPLKQLLQHLAREAGRK